MKTVLGITICKNFAMKIALEGESSMHKADLF